MIAVAIKAPEFALDEKESERLADAAANVARHYNIAASQKAMDWGNFAIAAAGIYGPRIFMASARRADEKKRAANDALAVVA